MKSIIWIFLLSGTLAIFGCSGEPKDESITQDEIGLRKNDLFSEDQAVDDKATFSTSAPGTSQKMDRSFENAPPMIPHTTEGFLPIKANMNMCLSCHMPAVAPAVKATPIPISHFTDYTADVALQGDVYVQTGENEVVAKDLGDKLYQGRFNCTQCHVPQAQITVAVENLFVPEYSSDQAKSQSNLSDVITQGVK